MMKLVDVMVGLLILSACTAGWGQLVLEAPAVIYEGQTILFNCSDQSSGEAVPNTTWSRDGSNISDDGDGDGTLQVLVPLSWEGSTLTCHDGAGSDNVSLTLHVVIRFPSITLSPINQTLNEGEPLSLECQALGLPAPDIRLFKDGTILFPFSPTLSVPAVSDDDAGSYTCVAMSSLGTATSEEAHIRVRFSPQLLTSPEDLDALNNSVALLNCSVGGDPAPSITWYHNMEELNTTGGRVQLLGNGSLLFDPLVLMDGGCYYCNASNELGAVDSDIAMLMVDLFPLFLETPRDGRVRLPMMTQLNCSASGIPEVTYTWLHCDGGGGGGGEVMLDGRVSEEGGALVFLTTERSDAGMYMCVAGNEHGNITSGCVPLEILALPFPPIDLMLVAAGSSWLNIAWGPSPNPNPPVNHYRVEYKLTFEPMGMETVATQRSLNITGLYPNAMYQVRVSAAVTDFGVGEGSAPLGALTLEGAPLAQLEDTPTNVSIQANSSSQLIVTWDIPRVLLLTSYLRTMLTVRSSSSDLIVHRQQQAVSPYPISELVPNTLYSLDLTLVFEGGEAGMPVRVNATTLEGVPGDAPVDVMATLQGSCILVTWDPPSLPNGDIISYTLYFLDSRVSVVTTFHQIQPFLPYTNYSITVSANTSVGEGPRGPEGGVVILTPQAAPPAPLGLVVEPLDSTSILVSWQTFNEEDVPGILASFTVVYNLFQQEVDPQESSVFLDELSPFTVYNISLSASTEAGMGPSTPALTTQTFGDVPRASLRVTEVLVMCPSHLLVKWASPNRMELGGPESETSYNITVTFEPSGGVVNSMLLPYTSSLNSYLISVPRPFTNYTIQLALLNQNGTGTYSNSVSVQSCDGAASPPVDIDLRVLNSTAVSVSWEAPPTIPGTLVGYVLRYRTESGDHIEVNTSRSEFVLAGLQPFTEYWLSLATQTNGPSGNFSSEANVTTLGDVPVVGVSGVVVELSGQCLPFQITWVGVALQDIRGPAHLANYSVMYEGGGEVGEVTVPYYQEPMVNLTDLSVNTTYNISVGVVNNFGPGPYSPVVTMTTPTEGVPSSPLSVSVVSWNATALEVQWAPPTFPNGRPLYYVYYRDTDNVDEDVDIDVDDSVDIDVDMFLATATPSSSPAVLVGLSAFTDYSILVLASTSCGVNYTEPLIGRTLEAPPSPPLNLTLLATLPTRVKVQWSPPAYSNGVITHYNVYCGGDQAMESSLTYYECDGLVSDTGYNISVRAVNGAGEGEGSSLSANTTCTPTPSVDPLEEEGVITISLGDSCSTRTSYLLVLVQALVTSPDGSFELPSKPLGMFSLEELLSLTEQYSNTGKRGRGRRQAINGGGRVYIAANLTEADVMMEPGFKIGDNEVYGNFTNHPLNPQVYYNIALWGRVAGTDTPLLAMHSSQQPIIVSAPTSPPPPPPPPPSSPSFPLIPVVAVSGAAGLIILAICMAALISCVCCCCSRSLDKASTYGGSSGRVDRSNSFRLSRKRYADPVEEFRANNRTEGLEDHPPVPVMGFINKLMVMRTNDNQLFLEEFGSIAMTAGMPTDVANLSINKARNRYNNILPYDATRVKVKGHGMDYINANYCSGYRKPRAYIATQGPLPETVGDFWRMAWEECVQTMVMLTNTQEKGKVKCEMYWPREVGRSAVHGYLDITLTAVTTLADYTIRKFTMQKVGSAKDPREVAQYHFTSWPDHGVPQYATAMLAMIRKIRCHYSEEGPMLVHCSAGVGRTGTFIVIDTMLQRLVNEEDMVDIYGHVSLLRTQRNYMVQTEDQYFYIHEAIAEALLCGNTEIPSGHLPGYVTELCSVIPEDESDTTNLELQFKRLALERNDPHRWMTACRDSNKTKNRFVNVLPYDSSRVCLEYSPGVDGSDYINASHVDSYRSRRAFIATQGPLANSVEDFWRMLWQYSVPVVVMLTDLTERGHECSVPYWPEDNLQSITYGKLKVDLNVERKSAAYSYRDLCVTNITTQEKRWVQHFQFHAWPEVGVPSPVVLLDFSREVQNLCQSLSTEGPILVHCSNGVGRTGVFLVLHIVLERVLAEGLIDVFQTVKNLRIQRPAMVQTLEQYHFCYDTVVTYLQSSEHLFPSPPQVTSSPSHKRSSSQRGSKHGSRHGSRSSSIDKKSKTVSPARSPTRTGSLRNTPVHSDTKKDSPMGTLELHNNGVTTQFYGGSEATSTFGSHVTPESSQLSQQAEELVPVAVSIPSPLALHAQGAAPRAPHLSGQLLEPAPAQNMHSTIVIDSSLDKSGESTRL